jgi:hypothetical protein
MAETLSTMAALVVMVRETIALVREAFALARAVKVWVQRNRRS